MASLTAQDYISRMKHAIGNANPSQGITLMDMLNEALRKLFDYSDWEWRKRPPAMLDFVANQDWLNLPPDFGQGELISVHPIFYHVLGIRKVGLSDIARMRGFPFQNLSVFYVAVSFPTQSNTATPPSQARLEIWPTPSMSVTEACRIVYRAGAITLTNSTDIPNIPPAFEDALAMLARGITRRYEFDNDVSEYQLALQELERLRDVDGMTDPEEGRITGGAVLQRGMPWGAYRPFDPSAALVRR